MLRGMVLKNFVNFEERHFFDFSKIGNGPYVFVGASSTGKTAALELIRRCMDDKLNSSLTNRCNPNEIAYVFCEFHIKIPKYGSTVITGIIVDKTDSIRKEPNGAVGGDKKDSRDLETDNKTMFHKMMIFSTENGTMHFFSKRYLEKKGGGIVDDNNLVELCPDLLKEVVENEAIQAKTDYKISQRIKERFDDDFVSNVLREIKSSKEVLTNNPCLKVWDEMQKGFVGVFSMRGIGTFQWTKSDFIENKYKSDNYEKASDQAEIITSLFKNNKVKKEKEQRYLDFLTSPNVFHFDTDSDNEQIVVKQDKFTFPLLKTSVGVIEAKQFSLIMAHTSFQTICLEEPDRGMHPQMIERMKEVLYRESESKTIIVVTHNPYFLDSRSIENTFIFFKRKTVACVQNIGGLLECNPVRKLIELEDLKRILFSSHVLFVEAKSDKLVLQSIFRHIFTTPRRSSDTELAILCYEIIPMGGKEIKDKVANFCESINIKYAFILDRDAYIKAKNGYIISIDEYPAYVPRSKMLRDLRFNDLSKQLKREKKTFLWERGDLEDFLLSRRVAFDDIANVLELKSEYWTKYELKTAIKLSLNNGLSEEQSKNLAGIIKNFYDINRLRKFLEDDP